MSYISKNLLDIKNSISKIAIKYNRNPDEIHLIAVSKTHPIELIKEANDAGQVDFGENKVQEVCEKHKELASVNWHLIGHLQTNKVKNIVPFVHLIHSVDSEKLLNEINKQAQKIDKIVNVLIQIKISDEESKSGCSEEEANFIFKNISNYPNVIIQGLMGIAEESENKELIFAQFQKLQKIFESTKNNNINQVNMKILSMGMSSDYEQAIAAGATHVRVGSAIFGKRNYEF